MFNFFADQPGNSKPANDEFGDKPEAGQTSSFENSGVESTGNINLNQEELAILLDVYFKNLQNAE